MKGKGKGTTGALTLEMVKIAELKMLPSISHRNCPNFRVLSDFRKDNYEFFKNCFCQSVMIASSIPVLLINLINKIINKQKKRFRQCLKMLYF